jgi:hypothetical protein
VLKRCLWCLKEQQEGLARDRRQDKEGFASISCLLLSMLAYIHKQALA